MRTPKDSLFERPPAITIASLLVIADNFLALYDREKSGNACALAGYASNQVSTQ